MTIKRVKNLELADVRQFAPYARSEWRKLRNWRAAFFAELSRLWVLKKNDKLVCVIGLKRLTYLGGGAEVFFFLGKDMHEHLISTIAFIKRAIRRMLKCTRALTVRVEPDFRSGNRFVTHLGFKLEQKSYEYNTYRMVL